MQGRRVEYSPHLYRPGEYGLWDGEWYGMTPNGLLAALRRHIVVEHGDRTVTVQPSILCNGGDRGTWHGYLKAGVWEEC